MSKGIYRRGINLRMTKTINHVQYRESCGTESIMEARAIRERWVAELRDAIANGKAVRKQKPEQVQLKETAFEELPKLYLDYSAGRFKSFNKHRYFVYTLTKRFKNKPLNDFKTADIENLQSAYIKDDYSVAYANRLTAVTKAMFTKALHWELVDESAREKVRRCKLLKGENKRLRWLTDEVVGT